MNVNAGRVRQCLRDFDFKNLFIQELNWSHCSNRPIDLELDGNIAQLSPFAELGGVVVYQVELLSSGEIPSSSLRRQIENKVKQITHEHIIIFVDADRNKSMWQWVRRGGGQQTATREYPYNKGQQGDFLLQKLDGIALDIEELDSEGKIAVIKVLERVTKAFDVEKVTKRFYDEFKTEHGSFCRFLKGLEVEDELAWYASVMLNRLMFIYFIQKKGFLNGDVNYLANKLRESKSKGANQFYRQFLIPLFFKGFAQEEKERSPEVNALLGKVPYLNGGLFLPHQLEIARGENINISDAAFERLFTFFNGYDWHLEYRPNRPDNEINPDVLGYIFEKYINQKQMGAYYTKEDITDYICKNTVIPFLFDKLEDMRYDELHPFPMKDVEPYIYDAVKQEGYLPTETQREYQARQKRYRQIQDDFAADKVSSINDLITYNLDIRQFAEDWVNGIEDPVTLRAFYFNCLTKVKVLDPAVGSGAFLFAALNLLEPLYEICLDKMTELGGPKYQDFSQELERVNQHPNREYFVLKNIIVNNLFGVDIIEEAVEICKLRLFLKLVAQIDDVDKIEPLPDIDFNIRAGNTLVGYATYDQTKKAVLGDLQRKFDMENDMERIDHNAANVDRAFQNFRALQTRIGIDSRDLVEAKEGLRKDLTKLEEELNSYLAGEYGVDINNIGANEKWQETHQPFHWFIDFYGIMKDGGFDVIIGNPPYVDYKTVKNEYTIHGYQTSVCGNLYAFILERSLALMNNLGRFGMIVPLSITFSGDFIRLRELLGHKFSHGWFSSYDNIPAALFTGVSQRCTICIGQQDSDHSNKYTWASPMYRWRSEYRESLIPNVCYTPVSNRAIQTREIPKLADISQKQVYSRIEEATSKPPSRYFYPDHTATLRFGFSQAGRNFLSVFIEDPPVLDASTLVGIEPSKIGYITARDYPTSLAMVSLCAGEVYFWYWLTRGDGFDVTTWIVSDFLKILNALSSTSFTLIAELGERLHSRRYEALVFKKNAGKYVGNFNYHYLYPLTRRSDLLMLADLDLDRKHAEDIFNYVQRVLSINVSAGEKSVPKQVKDMFLPESIDSNEKELFDRIDGLLKTHYSFTDEELDFIVNHDVEYHMVEENEDE